MGEFKVINACLTSTHKSLLNVKKMFAYPGGSNLRTLSLFFNPSGVSAVVKSVATCERGQKKQLVLRRKGECPRVTRTQDKKIRVWMQGPDWSCFRLFSSKSSCRSISAAAASSSTLRRCCNHGGEASRWNVRTSVLLAETWSIHE